MSIDRLGTIGAEVAMKAAADYMRAKGIVWTDAVITAVTDALRVTCKAAVGPALDDAKAAFEAGMPDAAQATFLASMRLAGIEAVKLAVTI